jgi:arylsulfatase A-like enzyme
VCGSSNIVIHFLTIFAYFFGCLIWFRFEANQHELVWVASAVIADFLFSVFLASLVTLFKAYARSVFSVAIIFIFSLFLIVNLESLSAVGRVIYWQDLKFALDRDFLSTTLAGWRPNIFFLGQLAFSIFACVFLVCSRPIRNHASYAAAALVSIVALSYQDAGGDWRTSSPFLAAVSAQDLEHGSSDSFAPIPGMEVVHHSTFPILLGAKQPRPNVILLIVEGLSGSYLAQSEIYKGQKQLPHLSGLAEQGFWVPNFVNHSQMTIRGLYSILCGDYPKLSLQSAKAKEYIHLDEMIRPVCLPTMLKNHGYRTIYAQAAPLSYMDKDEFMPSAGFEEVHGKEAFPHNYVDFRWGPDDKAFLEQAYELIHEVRESEDRPHFITLLTVGTHYPYAVPSGDITGRKVAAMFALDNAIRDFFDTLTRNGVLEDTLLIVTSDESHGFGTEPRSLNWGSFMAFGPGIAPQKNKRVFGSVDVMASTLDYLAIDSDAPGYSVFREYPTQRPILYRILDQVYSLDRAGRLINCPTPSRCETRNVLSESSIFRFDLPTSELSESESRTMYSEIAAIRYRADQSLQRLAITSEDIILDPKRYEIRSFESLNLLDGRYMSVDTNDSVRVDLKISFQGQGEVELIHQLAVVEESITDVASTIVLPTLSDGQSFTLKYSYRPEQKIDLLKPLFKAYSRDVRGYILLERLSITTVETDGEEELITITTSKLGRFRDTGNNKGPPK